MLIYLHLEIAAPAIQVPPHQGHSDPWLTCGFRNSVRVWFYNKIMLVESRKYKCSQISTKRNPPQKKKNRRLKLRGCQACDSSSG